MEWGYVLRYMKTLSKCSGNRPSHGRSAETRTHRLFFNLAVFDPIDCYVFSFFCSRVFSVSSVSFQAFPLGDPSIDTHISLGYPHGIPIRSSVSTTKGSAMSTDSHMTQRPLTPYPVPGLTEGGYKRCGRVLGDLGAGVFKIEPLGGSPTHNRGPFVNDEPDPERSLYWYAYCANKRGITLDIESGSGRGRERRACSTYRDRPQALGHARLGAQAWAYRRRAHRRDPWRAWVR